MGKEKSPGALLECRELRRRHSGDTIDLQRELLACSSCIGWRRYRRRIRQLGGNIVNETRPVLPITIGFLVGPQEDQALLSPGERYEEEALLFLIVPDLERIAAAEWGTLNHAIRR